MITFVKKIIRTKTFSDDKWIDVCNTAQKWLDEYSDRIEVISVQYLLQNDWYCIITFSQRVKS